MIEFLQSLLIPVSVLLLIILLIHKIMRTRIDAQSLYSFWWVFPLGLALFLLPIQWGIENSVVSSVISTFTVTASQLNIGQDQSFSYWGSVWLVGTAIMLLFAFGSYLLFRRNIKLSKVTGQTAQLVNSLAPKTLSVWQSENVESPMLVGIFKQLLILPLDFEQRFNQEQQQLILAHEICHFDRNDIYWNLIAYLIVTLFWFHPLVWMAYARFCRDQELSCDQHVLARKQTESRINYSKALIEVVNTSPLLSFAQLSFINYGDKNMMFERINNIKLNPASSKPKTALLLTIALAMVSGLSMAGNNVAGNSPLIHGDKAAVVNDKTEIKPLVRIEPKYPIKAAQERIEGAVLLKFDVKLDGSTTNVSVIKAVPNSVFDEVAITALTQWQYENPSNQVLKDNVVQLDFRMDNNSTFKSVNLIEKINVSSH